MTALAVLCGGCALVIVVLAYLVGRLQGDVRRLNDQVHRLSEGDEASPRDEPGAVGVVSVELPRQRPVRPELVEVVPTNPTGSSTEGEPHVAVITAMSDDGDELEVTRARVASVTLARPLIKVAAISFGLRRALRDEQRFRIRYAMRQELRRQTKMRRRRRAGRAPSKGSLS